MQRITVDEFKKRYGDNALDDFVVPQKQKVGTLRDVPSDLAETARGVFQAGKTTAQKINEAVTTSGLSPMQRITGAVVAPAQGVSRTASELVTGAAKLFTSDELEKSINEKIGIAGEKIGQTEIAQTLKQSYDSLPEDKKFEFQNIILPIAEVMATVGTGGASKSVMSSIMKGVSESLRKGVQGASTAIPSTSVLPKVIKGAGSALYKSAITPTVDEAKLLLDYRAKTPFLTRLSEFDLNAPQTRSQTALEKGIMGTESMIGVQARKEADKLWNTQIAPLVKNSDVQMTKDELFTPALERIASIEDPTRRKAMEDAFDALLEDYKDYPNTFSLEQAQKLKRELATFTPSKIFKGKEVANELRTLQADMASAVRQKTYDSFPDENIKKMYLDWANLDELEGLGIKAISEASFKAGSGTLLSGIWDMATTPIKTIGGGVLYRVGDMFEFTAPKGINTMGEYLESFGYVRPVPLPVSPSELSEER